MRILGQEFALIQWKHGRSLRLAFSPCDSCLALVGLREAPALNSLKFKVQSSKFKVRCLKFKVQSSKSGNGNWEFLIVGLGNYGIV